MGDVTVRLYAAAAEAAGAHQVSIQVREDPLLLRDLVDQLTQASPDPGSGGVGLRRVCAQSSYLINGTRAEVGSAQVSPGDTVDVLPPFAGG
ncbi:MoaD/ThiS family protein [Nesterenkonia muleiensis]|uniref:MoaD/ThiS family protein n=1 Tax=Nesterenkonia muleiensis TaxID=2282648 RepID=UPI000E71FDFC|nr:MoaD/ThiS family protein [Nesterenkonia muleiensis]